MNDIATLGFLILFGAAAWMGGVGWQRKRMLTELEDLYEKVYGKAYDRATSSMFRTAVRANAAIGRFRPRPPVHRIPDDDTVDLATHRSPDTTVVLPLRQPAEDRAA